MLARTFQIAPGVGPVTEVKLWRAGCTDWTQAAMGQRPAKISPITWNRLLDHISLLQTALARKDGAAVAATLRPRMWWRAIPDFLRNIACLDIETTGLAPGAHKITVISTLVGQEVRVFVRGENLDDFPRYIAPFPAVATFNGRWFDGPFIKTELGIDLPALHFDLRPILHQAGIRGGLKSVEKHFNIHRGSLDGVSGETAVALWNAWRRTGEKKYRDTLIAYNVEDSVNLDVLLRHAYNLLTRQIEAPFLPLSLPTAPPSRPVLPDPAVLKDIVKPPWEDPWARRTIAGIAGRYRGECGFLQDHPPEFKNALDEWHKRSKLG